MSAKTGDWYVYTGEDGDAIAVAMHGRGPQGGWQGISLARMELPSENKTREFINDAAKMMAAAPDLLTALTALVDAKALSGVREQVAGWNGEGKPDGPYERHPSRLGATVPKTTCGAVYELDEAMVTARAAIAKATAP